MIAHDTGHKGRPYARCHNGRIAFEEYTIAEAAVMPSAALNGPCTRCGTIRIRCS